MSSESEDESESLKLKKKKVDGAEKGDNWCSDANHPIHDDNI